ncbi:MAG: hypothetical protein II864_04035 [Prevotella sp.]|nr:hypothetical protein [Prevotella sp.]
MFFLIRQIKRTHKSKSEDAHADGVGDVNGDGKIDVEDVTSVVDIILSGKTYGYFYFGTTEPTAENFTSLPEAVASYTSIGEAAGATVPIAEGETKNQRDRLLIPSKQILHEHSLSTN